MLPEIKSAPIHTITLPILGKQINFRPYTVDQEKMFLSALDGGGKSSEVIMNFISILESTIEERQINVKDLYLIDFLTLVVNLKSKSKGSKVSFTKKSCKKCKQEFEFEIDTDKALKFEHTNTLKRMVKVTEDLSLELMPVKTNFLFDIDNSENKLDLYKITACHAISKVIYKDDVYKDFTTKELMEKVVKNLTRTHLLSIFEEFNNMITMYMEIEYVCTHCGEREVSKITNFLEFF